MKEIKVIFTTIASAIFSWLGILAVPVGILFACNIIDYKTGLDAAPQRADEGDTRPIKSYKSIQGIQKKVNMYLLILIMWMVDYMISTTLHEVFPTISYPNIFAIATACWLIFNEIISILENMDDCGTPIPPFLMPIMKKMRSTMHINIEGKDDCDENK